MPERIYRPDENIHGQSLPQKKQRFWELDFLRGLCVLLMVVDHFFFSADVILSTAVWPWSQEFWTGLNQFAQIYWVAQSRNIARFVVICTFFLISGISCTLSHNNLARALKTLAAGLVITMVTWLGDSFFSTGVVIIFGVIHMLGCAMLMYSLVELLGRLLAFVVEGRRTKSLSLWIRRLLPAAVGIAGLIVFFVMPLGHFQETSAFINVDGKKVEFFYTSLVTDVESSSSFLYFLVEVTEPFFASADYFPIMPWAFVVLVGSGIGALVYQTRAKTFLRPLDGVWNRPLTFLGRHALWFYLLHQIVIVAFFFAVGGIYSISGK